MMGAQPRSDLAGLQVLLVDDDAGFLQELADGLGSAGIVPVLSRSPVDALTLVERRPSIGLVMADLVMPGMDGLEFLWILSRLAAPAAPPCIVMTGHASLDRAVAAMRVRAADLLTKPFNLEDALRAIVRLREPVTGRRLGPGPEPSDLDGRERLRVGLIRRSLVARREREQLLGPELLGDHAWTMILEL